MLGIADEASMWVAVPVAFATGWAWFGSYNLAMIRLNPVAPGAAVGVTQTGAFVGAIVGPAGLGFLADHFSFTAAWLAAAAASLSAAAIDLRRSADSCCASRARAACASSAIRRRGMRRSACER